MIYCDAAAAAHAGWRFKLIGSVNSNRRWFRAIFTSQSDEIIINDAEDNNEIYTRTIQLNYFCKIIHFKKIIFEKKRKRVERKRTFHLCAVVCSRAHPELAIANNRMETFNYCVSLVVARHELGALLHIFQREKKSFFCIFASKSLRRRALRLRNFSTFAALFPRLHRNGTQIN